MLLDNGLQPFVIITQKGFALHKYFFYFVQISQYLRWLTLMDTSDILINSSNSWIVVLRYIRFVQVSSKLNKI